MVRALFSILFYFTTFASISKAEVIGLSVQCWEPNWQFDLKLNFMASNNYKFTDYYFNIGIHNVEAKTATSNMQYNLGGFFTQGGYFREVNKIYYVYAFMPSGNIIYPEIDKPTIDMTFNIITLATRKQTNMQLTCDVVNIDSAPSILQK